MSVRVEVMDCMFGRPAAGVMVRLLREADGCWQELASVLTDQAGCAATLEPAPRRGRYRLALSLDEYFVGLGVEPFQSRVDVVFRIFHTGEVARLLLMITPSSCSVCRLITDAPEETLAIA